MSVVYGCKEVQEDNTQRTIVFFISVEISHWRSWKNDARVMENHGKIMEFDSGKALGTLLFGTCILEKRKYFYKNHGKIMEFHSGIRRETLVQLLY